MGRACPAGLPAPGSPPLPTRLPAASASSTSPRNRGPSGSEPTPHHVMLAAVLCSWPLHCGPLAGQGGGLQGGPDGLCPPLPFLAPTAAPSVLGSARRGDAAVHPVPPWLSLAMLGNRPTTALLPFWFSQPVEVESPPKRCPRAGAGEWPASPRSAHPACRLTLPGGRGTPGSPLIDEPGTFPVPSALPAVFPS